MNSKPWIPLLLVSGLVLMLAGPLSVSFLMPAEALWSDADAERLNQARANLHAATHADQPHQHSPEYGPHGAGSPDVHKNPVPDFASAQREYDQEHARLERSHARRDWLWYGTSILGALLAAAGIAGHFLAGRS
jgi:hypothetical protein